MDTDNTNWFGYYLNRTENILMSSPGQWLAFLDMASWLYTYPFTAQVCIYFQCPKARKLDTYEGWKEKGRQVRKYERSIVLPSSGKPLNFFDISSTVIIDKNRDLENSGEWSITPDDYSLVAKKLPGNSKTIKEALENEIKRLLFRYEQDIDPFKDASIRYILDRRLCTNFFGIDFDSLSNMPEDKFDFVRAGITISDISGEILHEIEDIIQTQRENETEKQMHDIAGLQQEESNGRNREIISTDTVQTGRGLPDPGHIPGGSGSVTDNALRKNQVELPSGGKTDVLHAALQDGKDNKAPAGNTGSVPEERGRAGETDDGKRESDPGPEDAESYGVGETGEQHNIGSQGDSNKRDNRKLTLPPFSSRHFASVNVSEIDLYPDGIKDIFGTYNTTPDFHYSEDNLYTGDEVPYMGDEALITDINDIADSVEFTVNGRKSREMKGAAEILTGKNVNAQRRFRVEYTDVNGRDIWFLYDSASGKPYVSNEKLMIWNEENSARAFANNMNNNTEYMDRRERQAFLQELQTHKAVDLRPFEGGNYAVFGPQARLISGMSEFKDLTVIDLRNIQKSLGSEDMLTVPESQAERFRKTLRRSGFEITEASDTFALARDVPYIINLHTDSDKVKDNTAYLLSDFDRLVTEEKQAEFSFLLVMNDGKIYADRMGAHTGSLMDFFWSKPIYENIAYRLETTAVLERHDEVLMKGNYNPNEMISDARKMPIVSMKVKYADGGYKMYGLVADRLSEGDLMLRDFGNDLSKAAEYVTEHREDVTGYRKPPVLEVPETDESLKSVTFIRTGNYYEVYDDEAVYVADKLNLTLMYKEYDNSYRLMVGLSCSALGSGAIKTLNDSGVDVNVIEFGFTSTKKTRDELRDGDIVQSAADVYLVSKDEDKLSFVLLDRNTGRKREDERVPGRLYDSVYYSVLTDSDEQQRTREETAETEEITLPETNDSKEIYAHNAEAIKVLNAITDEGRKPTEEERAVLSLYKGFGSIPEVFDASDSGWKDEYSELKSILSEEDYSRLSSTSVREGFFTPEVSAAMHKALENFGFTGGNVLTPLSDDGSYLSGINTHMKGSNVYALTEDKIGADIAKVLYPDFVVLPRNFEHTNFTNNTFDVAFGSVPVKDHSFLDNDYRYEKFTLSEYYIAKSIDKIRPGGIAALAVPQSLMDSEDIKARLYFAERADLIGAVRLPEELGFDLVFLQKRDTLRILSQRTAPAWVKTEDGKNRYFTDNPEMVISPDLDLSEALERCIGSMKGQITEVELASGGELSESAIPSDPDVRNYSYTVNSYSGDIYFKEDSVMTKVNVPKTKADRIRGLVKIRDLARELIDKQANNKDDSVLTGVRDELNEAYDEFTEKYGHITSRANRLAMQDDSSYPLLCSLEKTDDENNFTGKADLFFKRTISVNEVPERAETFAQAVSISLSEKGRVDLDYMAGLCGTSTEEMLKHNSGLIYKNPQTEQWETADEYLSGNVRQKLRIAQVFASQSDEFAVNVKALEAVQPKDLTADEISAKLGATWIEPKYINYFMKEVLGASGLHTAYYTPITGKWNISNKNSVWLFWDNSYIREIYGTNDVNALELLENALNLHDTTITRKDREGKYYVDEKATREANIKQELLRNKFSDWLFSDITRRDELCAVYNEKFNSIRPREYDASFLTFPGMNPEITLKDYQKEGAARILFGKNTMLAHAVGAGKTFEMAAAAMEGKRMGLFHKSLFVVPNHITEQWGSEFLRLYPSANILVATKKDFEAKNRKKFCARIATGDWDAVIIGQSQFEKIPLSDRNKTRFLKQELWDIQDAIDNARYNKCIKALEKEKKDVIKKIKQLAETGQDDVVTFEELGIDKLFIDESQNYKNLYIYSKMSNVAGIPHESAKKATDLLLKCKYMDELTGYRGIVFATGTPISNNMAELYNNMKYLQYDTLKRLNLTTFDAWASTFTDAVRAAEIKPEGTGFQVKTRLKYHNIPELMNIFRECADIKPADVINLPGPEAEYHNEILKPTEFQKEIIKELGKRADDIRNGHVDSTKDNMLKITTDGRRLALDQRLINPYIDSAKDTKITRCADNIAKIYKEYSSTRSAQLVFCDISTPRTDSNYSVYNRLLVTLLKKGIPQEEIAFIHDAKTESKKAELFAKVRSGNIRVLIGSTAKMGEGTNVQDRLIALHHLDVPWRPSDIEQQEGRIIRFGNMHEKVHIYRYITEGTFDSYSWQLLEQKQKFISQIMTSRSPVRSADDIDDTVLTYAEVKALAAGNPLLKEKTDLDMKVNMLQQMKAEYNKQKFALENAIYKELPSKISEQSEIIEKLEKDSEKLSAYKDKDFSMTIQDKTYTDPEKAFEAAALILRDAKPIEDTDSKVTGEFCGFDIKAGYNANRERSLIFSGSYDHKVPLAKSAEGSTRKVTFLADLTENELRSARENLKVLEGQMEQSKEDVKKPFMYEEELENAKKRLFEIEEEMNRTEDIPEKEEERDDAFASPGIIMKEYKELTEENFLTDDARTFEGAFGEDKDSIRTIIEIKGDDKTMGRIADSGIGTGGRVVMTMTDKDNTIYFHKADRFGNMNKDGIRADRILTPDEYALSQKILQSSIDGFKDELSKIDLDQVRQVRIKLREHYAEMYENDDDVPDYFKAMDIGDDFIKNNHVFIGQLVKMRDYDPVTSDREVAALGFALEDVGLVPRFTKEDFVLTEDVLKQSESHVYTIPPSGRNKAKSIAHFDLTPTPELYARLRKNGVIRTDKTDDKVFIESNCDDHFFIGIPEKEGHTSHVAKGKEFFTPEEITTVNKAAQELLDAHSAKKEKDALVSFVLKNDKEAVDTLMTEVPGLTKTKAAELIATFESEKQDGWDDGSDMGSVTHMQVALYKNLCDSPDFDKGKQREYIEKAKLAFGSIAYSKYGVVTKEKLQLTKDNDVYRYYSTQRPVGPLTFPKGDLKGIVNFENGRVYCAEIARPAWGYVEYNSPISEQDAKNYELIKGFQKGRVVEMQDQDGNSRAEVVNDEKEPNSLTSLVRDANETSVSTKKKTKEAAHEKSI